MFLSKLKYFLNLDKTEPITRYRKKQFPLSEKIYCLLPIIDKDMQTCYLCSISIPFDISSSVITYRQRQLYLHFTKSKSPFLSILHFYEILEGLEVITHPRYRGGVIFSQQFVSVCLYVCECVSVYVCPALLVNKISAERIN